MPLDSPSKTKRAPNKEVSESSLDPSVRTGEGLRDVLFDEIDSLRSGRGDRRRALAVANLAQQIINTVKVELDYERHLALLGTTATKPGIGQAAVKTLKLGNGVA